MIYSVSPQVVDHVHFHMIPKPSASDEAGLVVGWPTQQDVSLAKRGVCWKLMTTLFAVGNGRYQGNLRRDEKENRECVIVIYQGCGELLKEGVSRCYGFQAVKEA